MSPSGVMMRDVKPAPASLVGVATVLAAKISSLGLVVPTSPVLEVRLFPLAPIARSSAETPEYSRARAHRETASIG